MLGLCVKRGLFQGILVAHSCRFGVPEGKGSHASHLILNRGGRVADQRDGFERTGGSPKMCGDGVCRAVVFLLSPLLRRRLVLRHALAMRSADSDCGHATPICLRRVTTIVLQCMNSIHFIWIISYRRASWDLCICMSCVGLYDLHQLLLLLPNPQLFRHIMCS